MSRSFTTPTKATPIPTKATSTTGSPSAKPADYLKHFFTVKTPVPCG